MLIKNISIVYEDKIEVTDLLIEDGIIKQIGQNLSSNGEVFEGTNKYLFPKLIDVGTNFSDGNVKALSRIAQKAKDSGVGTIINSSKTNPVLNDETALEALQLKSSFENIRFKPLINAKKEDGLSNMAILLNKGGVAIEIDSDYDMNLIARAFEYAKLKNVPIVCNANSKSLQGAGMVASGKVANKLGVAGVSELCESVEVVKIAHMARYYEVEVLFLHLSVKSSLHLANGCKTSVSIHHILNDSGACKDFNTKAKIYPPLREKLVDSLDAIDIITSMHAKSTALNKDLAFAQASFGVDALGEFLPLCYSLVDTKVLDMVSLIQKICYNPAKIFGIDNTIAPQKPFDGVIFDPEYSFCVKNGDSLYEGMQLKGKTLLL